MTSQEKAKELVDSFTYILGYSDFFTNKKETKQCALKCVDEMKKASYRITQHLPPDWIGREQEYYDEIKQEIEKL